MDVGTAIALGGAGVGILTTAGFAIAALVFRSRLASRELDLEVVRRERDLATAERDAAFEINARQSAQLKKLREARQEEYAEHAERKDPGGGDAVDAALARLRELHPDADGDALRAGADQPVPDRGSADAGGSEPDLLSDDRDTGRRGRTGSLL